MQRFRTTAVLTQLETHGFRMHREQLAARSDALGLVTRHPQPGQDLRTVQRSWSQAQIDELLESLVMSQRLLTQGVLAKLAEHGIHIHREKLALVSDALGLVTRSPGATSAHGRRWSEAHIEILVRAFRLHETYGLTWDLIHTLLKHGELPSSVHAEMAELHQIAAAVDVRSPAADPEVVHRLRRLTPAARSAGAVKARSANKARRRQGAA